MTGLFVPHNSRELAYAVLVDSEGQRGYAEERFEDLLAREEYSRAEKGLAKELVATVIRRQMTLDAILSDCVRRGQQDVEPELWTILRLGVAQLVLLEGVAVHAAVNETVNLAKRVGRGGWSGFVNGVLRSVTRLVTDEYETAPQSNNVPLTNGRYRHLTADLFWEPQQNPLGYLSAAFSFPPWLVKRWLTRFSPTELIPLLFWWNTPAPLTLRVNPLRGTPAAYRERLAEAPATAELLLPAEQSPSGDFPETIRLTGSCPISLLPGFDEGALSIQDASAQYPARWLAPQPGERIWDVCAAPGGKTTHLAELQKDQGQIVASDVQADRLGLIEDNVQRLGLRSITTAVLSRELDHAPHSDFDAALIDVPCSNTGVLGKRPEARWRLKPADLVELPDLQRQILKLALTNIRAGGRAVYSTCSIEPEENRGLVQRVLQELPEWSLIREHDHLPGQPGDGGYLALLQRAETTG